MYVAAICKLGYNVISSYDHTLIFHRFDSTPNIQTVRGETPLHLATRANQTDIIRVLLRHGGDANAQAREQTTPLHIASRIGNTDIVALLLQHGGKVDAVTKVSSVQFWKG